MEGIVLAAVLWPVVLVAVALALGSLLRRADRAEEGRRRRSVPVRVERLPDHEPGADPVGDTQDAQAG